VAKDGEVMSTYEQLDDPIARAAMLRIDEDYERIAEQARVRALGARPTA